MDLSARSSRWAKPLTSDPTPDQGGTCVAAPNDAEEVLQDTYSEEAANLGEKISSRIHQSLDQAMKQTEQAVLAIGANISALFDIAKLSNDQATQSLSGLVGKQSSIAHNDATNSSLQSLLDRQRQSINLLINRAQNFVEHQTRLIEESNSRFRRVKSSIASIASFTSGSRLLAMNAHIESTRLGPHGKAFAIVAGEMKKLSGQIKEANDEIEGAVKRVSVAMHRLYDDAAEMEDDLCDFSQKLAAEVEDIERRSHALTNSLTQTLSQITASNEELMKHSLTAMSELQFQDPLAQALLRTGHEIRKMQLLLQDGTCQDIDLADLDEQVGRDGTVYRSAGEIELF